MIIQISAGSGPVEVRRFVFFLAERVASMCEAQGIALRRVNDEGEEAPRSISLMVACLPRGFAAGTHALIARSAARGRSSRKRWFVAVSLHEEQATRGAELSARDLEFSACRAGGPGGQNVNKVSSAVRAVHRPSGISVRASEARSQVTNKQLAIARIKQRLTAQAREEQRSAQGEQRAAHTKLVRGNAVASYTMTDGRLMPLA